MRHMPLSPGAESPGISAARLPRKIKVDMPLHVFVPKPGYDSWDLYLTEAEAGELAGALIDALNKEDD